MASKSEIVAHIAGRIFAADHGATVLQDRMHEHPQIVCDMAVECALNILVEVERQIKEREKDSLQMELDL